VLHVIRERRPDAIAAQDLSQDTNLEVDPRPSDPAARRSPWSRSMSRAEISQTSRLPKRCDSVLTECAYPDRVRGARFCFESSHSLAAAANSGVFCGLGTLITPRSRSWCRFRSTSAATFLLRVRALSRISAPL
jgi:hypothetical protein